MQKASQAKDNTTASRNPMSEIIDRLITITYLSIQDYGPSFAHDLDSYTPWLPTPTTSPFIFIKGL
jgi:hypothetical protein